MPPPRPFALSDLIGFSPLDFRALFIIAAYDDTLRRRLRLNTGFGGHSRRVGVMFTDVLQHGGCHVLKYLEIRDLARLQMTCANIVIHDREWKRHLPKLNTGDTWKRTAQKYARISVASSLLGTPVHVSKAGIPIVKMHSYEQHVYAIDASRAIWKSTDGSEWHSVHPGDASFHPHMHCVSFLRHQKILVFGSHYGVWVIKLDDPVKIARVCNYGIDALDTFDEKDSGQVYIYAITVDGALCITQCSGDLFGTDQRTFTHVRHMARAVTCIAATCTPLQCVIGTTMGYVYTYTPGAQLIGICSFSDETVIHVRCVGDDIVAHCKSGAIAATKLTRHTGNFFYAVNPRLDQNMPTVCVGDVLVCFSYWSQHTIDLHKRSVRQHATHRKCGSSTCALSAVEIIQDASALLIGDINGDVSIVPL